VARRVVIIGLLLVAAVFLWPIGDDLVRQLPSILLRRSPHDVYTRKLRADGLDRTAPGLAWLADSERALREPVEAGMVHAGAGRFDAARTAYGWRFQVRRGQRITIAVASPVAVFIDLFRHDDGERVASAASGSSTLVYGVNADADVVARIQAPLDAADVPFRVLQRADATLAFPVQGVTPRAVGGGFGEGRDGGRRRHEGIDIFAPRGTPALAAVDGWVTAQTTNRLGGNVVWIWSMRHRVGLYYAHLDRHAVSPGARVRAGDVVGYVGTTGNARGTSPHLHFGVYAPPDGAVDPLPFVCDAPCGERLMQPDRLPSHGTEVKDDS
jgi:murein DD-endopeptidase MepM/ murein hydrolase activator NlpD